MTAKAPAKTTAKAPAKTQEMPVTAEDRDEAPEVPTAKATPHGFGPGSVIA